MNKAKFITLEGSEGAGKTTALNVITQKLEEWGVSFIVTREPGGETNGEAIRELLLYSDHLEVKTELLLMFAARNEHLIKVIRPALQKGQWVLSDRFVDASFAYQGMGRGVEWSTIAYFEQMIVAETNPDLTLYLDVDPSVGLQRAAKRSAKDRIEQEDLHFFENIRQGYLKRLNEHPERIKKINANSTIHEVEKQIIKTLEAAREELFEC